MSCASIYAQDSVRILHFSSTTKTEKPFNYVLKSNEKTDRIIAQYQVKQWEKGYIAFSFDSLFAKSDTLNITYNKGQKYIWGELKIKENTGTKQDKYFLNNTPFSLKGTERQLMAILSSYENNGYPFVSLYFDSLTIIDKKINAILKIEKNYLYKIDSIVIKGNSKINKKYLSNLIEISEGDTYNESLIQEIDNKLKNNLFVHSKTPVKIIFTENTCKLILDLEKVKSNKFDGMIGFLPNPKTNKIQLSGDVQLHLANSFNHAEILDFNWKKLNENGQELKTNIQYPYLFNTVFGVDGVLYMLKQDTSFLSVEQKLGVFYSFNSNNFLKLFVNNRTSSVLSSSSLYASTSGFGDYKATLFGANLLINKTDNIFNPRKGKYLDIETMIGNKSTSTYTNISDSIINRKSMQIIIGAKLGSYFSLNKRFVYKLLVQGQTITDDQLLTNEFFRIGGLKTLRGFDEVSIYASDYSILTNELRFLLEERSYLFVFTDLAWYQKRMMNNTTISDTPYGFGAGISFETKAGNFILTYALGKQFSNPIEFKNAKIHFGINTSF